MILGRWLVVAAMAWAGPALAQAPSGPPAAEVGNQIRLNPPGGGGQPSLPGSGASALLTGTTSEETARLLASAGFEAARVVQDEKGDYVRLRSDYGDSFVFHLNCSDGRCRSLMFTAFLERRRGASLAFVNGYNLKTLHTKMARNEAGEIVLTMPASLDRGVSPEHLRALGAFWIQVHRDALAWR